VQIWLALPLAEAGCSMDEVMAVLGHLTGDETREHAHQAHRKVMARSAMDKWERITIKSGKRRSRENG
jgi:hypothetical protein